MERQLIPWRCSKPKCHLQKAKGYYYYKKKERILFNKGMNENKNKKKTVAICTEIAVKLEIPGIQNVAKM